MEDNWNLHNRPDRGERVLCCDKYGCLYVDYITDYEDEENDWDSGDSPVAWCPLPSLSMSVREALNRIRIDNDIEQSRIEKERLVMEEEKIRLVQDFINSYCQQDKIEEFERRYNVVRKTHSIEKRNT